VNGEWSAVSGLSIHKNSEGFQTPRYLFYEIEIFKPIAIFVL